MNKDKIKLAVVGVGNCCSSLVQGISYYNSYRKNQNGINKIKIGNYYAHDIEVVAAFDIDRRKVGKNLKQALFSEPNNTKIFCNDIGHENVIVHMGQILDGYSDHFNEYLTAVKIELSDCVQPDKEKVVKIIKDSGAEILVNYLPVGSQKATEFYMECALEAKVGVVNCIPVFIASNEKWEKKFKEKGLPIIGDDIKSQIGATIIHRVLVDLIQQRGACLNNTYQLNVAGNTDFLNMLNKKRSVVKKKSKTEAVQSILNERLGDEHIHIGPSDFVPWLKDNKICFLRLDGTIFGDVPFNIELKLSVEDSPNSAGVVIDAIRCCKLALDKGEKGAIISPSACFMKHPPKQFKDHIAWKILEDFVK